MEQKPLHYKKLSEASPGPFDAIIIGTGMGGLCCGAALARYGQRVLLLEQHYVPGGYTHTFSRKGFTWDVGVHAVSEMRPEDLPAKMLSWLSGGEIEMRSLGDPYDVFYYPDGFSIGFPDSKEKFFNVLAEKFPHEKDNLKKYFALVEKVAKACLPYFPLRTFPEWLDKTASRALHLFGRDWWRVTTEEVLAGITRDEKLKTVLTAQWGYYGVIPSRSPFAMHALAQRSFWNGAFYPERGSQVIAEKLLKVVQDAGGECLVRASVKELILHGGTAVGVRLEGGEEFLARRVISAAGAKATVNHILPESQREQVWARQISQLRSSPSYICLYLGFEGDIRQAGAGSSNLWFNETWSREEGHWDLSQEASRTPILYVSFPSLKDPHHEAGPTQRHTGECVTFVDWGSFVSWQHTRRGKREKDYMLLKAEIQERFLAQLQKHCPQILKHLVYHELSTPLSAQFFTRADRGAIYGLEATPERFACSQLRTRTPIKRFYLSGTDVATLGIGGAIVSGMMTAATIDKRVYLKMI